MAEVKRISPIKNNSENNNPLFRTIITPLLFEMCGIIPLLLVAFGFINVSAGVALRNTLVYQYSFIFFILAASFFVYSTYVFLKSRNACNISGLKQHQKPIIVSFIALIAFEALILFLIQIIERIVYGKSLTYFADFVTIGPFLIGVLVVFILFLKLKRS